MYHTRLGAGGRRRLRDRPRLRVHLRLVNWVNRRAISSRRDTPHHRVRLPEHGVVARCHRFMLGTAAGIPVQ